MRPPETCADLRAAPRKVTEALEEVCMVTTQEMGEAVGLAPETVDEITRIAYGRTNALLRFDWAAASKAAGALDRHEAAQALAIDAILTGEPDPRDAIAAATKEWSRELYASVKGSFVRRPDTIEPLATAPDEAGRPLVAAGPPVADTVAARVDAQEVLKGLRLSLKQRETVAALAATDGDRRSAANLLGVTVDTLRMRINAIRKAHPELASA